MEKKGSQKLLCWTKNDIVSVTITYIVNVILFTGLFVALLYMRTYGTNGFSEFFSKGYKIFNFCIILFFIIAALFLYFFFEDRDFLKDSANSEMLFLILQTGLLICFLTETFINIYVRPLAFVAVTVLFLTNSRKAIFLNFIFAILLFLFDCFSGTMESFNYQSEVFFLVMTVTSGILAIYITKEVYSRFRLLVLGFVISIPCLICVALPNVGVGGSHILAELASALCSGLLVAICTIILLPVFELLFKKVTCFKLAELTDHKAKFIRKMIQNAPGTFNHAIIVSNLAEACATAIGEDALLARTCAYYHDIGKLRRPEFFKENQADGMNPHDDLTPELSANIIKSHTIDGFHYMMKNRLPKEVADVVLQHHGTLPILYFYDKAKKFTDGEVSYTKYCYAGPKPQTKIAAIIMIADGCEAITRSLKDRSRENVSVAVKKIVNDRMQLGQFDECEITIKEINIIIHTVINSLSGIYHSRIEYPKVRLDGIEVKPPLSDNEAMK